MAGLLDPVCEVDPCCCTKEEDKMSLAKAAGKLDVAQVEKLFREEDHTDEEKNGAVRRAAAGGERFVKKPELRSCGPLFETGKICVILNHYQSVTLVMSGEHLTITKALHL